MILVIIGACASRMLLVAMPLILLLLTSSVLAIYKVVSRVSVASFSRSLVSLRFELELKISTSMMCSLGLVNWHSHEDSIFLHKWSNCLIRLLLEGSEYLPCKSLEIGSFKANPVGTKYHVETNLVPSSPDQLRRKLTCSSSDFSFTGLEKKFALSFKFLECLWSVQWMPVYGLDR